MRSSGMAALAAATHLGLRLLTGVALGLAATATRAEVCADCFAIFVMPDVQFYTTLENQPEGAARSIHWSGKAASDYPQGQTGREPDRDSSGREDGE